MIQLQSILSKIINNNCDFCCLCFNTTDAGFLSLADEVVLLDNSEGCNVKISELLAYVFGDSDLEHMSTFSSVCQQCSTTVINGYKFIRECRENLQHLSTTIQNLIDNLQHAPHDVQDCQNLFIEFRPELSFSPLYYDSISSLSNVKDALKRFHLMSHAGKEPFKSKQEIKDDKNTYKCKVCDEVYPTSISLKSHVVETHNPKFPCIDCDKIFTLKSLLEAHRDKIHLSLVCPECGKTFKDHNKLKTHEKSHYVKIICPDCGRIYKNKNTFKKHLENNICQIETRHAPAAAQYTCDYCQKKYTQKMTLRVHIQYEHLNYKYLKCNWCDKKFWCKSRLNAHAVKHTKERNYICNICDGKFVTKESLLYHTRIHTGERPYPCPHCESRFLSASRRTAHIKNHHMDPTVECDICCAKFRSHYYLRKHKRIHTASKPIDNQSSSPPKVVKKIIYPPVTYDTNVSTNNEKVTVQNENNEESSQNEQNLFCDSISNDDRIIMLPAEKTEIIETEVVESEGMVEYNMYQLMEGTVSQSAEDKPMYMEVTEGDKKYFVRVAQHV